MAHDPRALDYTRSISQNLNVLLFSKNTSRILAVTTTRQSTHAHPQATALVSACRPNNTHKPLPVSAHTPRVHATRHKTETRCTHTRSQKRHARLAPQHPHWGLRAHHHLRRAHCVIPCGTAASAHPDLPSNINKDLVTREIGAHPGDAHTTVPWTALSLLGRRSTRLNILGAAAPANRPANRPSNRLTAPPPIDGASLTTPSHL